MRDRFELARTLIDALRRRFEILQHMAPVDCFVPEEKIIFPNGLDQSRHL